MILLRSAAPSPGIATIFSKPIGDSVCDAASPVRQKSAFRRRVRPVVNFPVWTTLSEAASSDCRFPVSSRTEGCPPVRAPTTPP